MRRRFFATRATSSEGMPNNEIWYTTSDRTALSPYSAPSGLVSNTYSNGLGKMTFSADVTALPASMYNSKTTLTSIYIPSSVTSVGSDAFANCTGLTAAYIYDLSAWCNIAFAGYRSNPLYHAYNLYLNDVLVTNLVVPDGITTIKTYAFRACQSITSAKFPDSLTTIGDLCFIDCINLKNVTIPDNVASIGGSAFERCTSMTDMTIGSGCTSIGGNALKGCTKLTAIYCKATTPPTVLSTTFTSVPTTCVVYVPTSAVSAYQSASYWKNFTIQEYDF